MLADVWSYLLGIFIVLDPMSRVYQLRYICCTCVSSFIGKSCWQTATSYRDKVMINNKAVIIIDLKNEKNGQPTAAP